MKYRVELTFGSLCFIKHAFGVPLDSNSSMYLTDIGKSRLLYADIKPGTKALDRPFTVTGSCEASYIVLPTQVASLKAEPLRAGSDEVISATARVVVTRTTGPVASLVQSGHTYTGDITYYDVTVGTGSCGTYATNADNVVALSHVDMNNGPNPNENPLCGREISIHYNGNAYQAQIWDTCPSCDSGSLDLPQPLFDAIAPDGDGRVHDVSWILT